jgi:hypothetical protein
MFRLECEWLISRSFPRRRATRLSLVSAGGDVDDTAGGKAGLRTASTINEAASAAHVERTATSAGIQPQRALLVVHRPTLISNCSGPKAPGSARGGGMRILAVVCSHRGKSVVVDVQYVTRVDPGWYSIDCARTLDDFQARPSARLVSVHSCVDRCGRR